MSAADEKLIVGKVSGVYGVHGWIKVFSETDPREGIGGYNPWYLTKDDHGKSSWREYQLAACRPHSGTIIARLAGVDDRDAAMRLIGALIGIRPEQLPDSGKDEYYWRDLIGLRVVNSEGVELGMVRRLLETGANDVLVVSSGEPGGREHLLPWTPGKAILEVDLDHGVIRVDWDANF